MIRFAAFLNLSQLPERIVGIVDIIAARIGYSRYISGFIVGVAFILSRAAVYRADVSGYQRIRCIGTVASVAIARNVSEAFIT